MISAVRVETAAARVFAGVRGHARGNNVAKTMLSLLDPAWAFVRSGAVKSDGHNIAVYYCGAGGVDIEAGASVLEAFPDSGQIRCRATPSGTVATVTLLGPYRLIGDAHAAITNWCAANARVPAGPNWEIYGHWIEDESQLRTDIYYLLK